MFSDIKEGKANFSCLGISSPSTALAIQLHNVNSHFYSHILTEENVNNHVHV